jgi:hypothetical protein
MTAKGDGRGLAPSIRNIGNRVVNFALFPHYLRCLMGQGGVDGDCIAGMESLEEGNISVLLGIEPWFFHPPVLA